jgi:hypothetical protein
MISVVDNSAMMHLSTYCLEREIVSRESNKSIGLRWQGGNMVAFRIIVSAGIVIAGLLSGVFWVQAANAKVNAPPGAKEGVGYGGSPVNVTDSSGVVIDFLQSYRAQSKWNSRAALASAAAAILAAIYFLFGMIG